MTAKRFICLLFLLPVAALASLSYAQQKPEAFEEFLSKFTTSASFQYARVSFPLESPILLLNEKEVEKSFPFTKEKWVLLDSELLKVNKVFVEEDENTFVSRYVLDEPARKEFEAGFEDSELDLRLVFELRNGKWFVTDCYNSWYGFDLPAEELPEVVKAVQEENKSFIELYP